VVREAEVAAHQVAAGRVRAVGIAQFAVEGLAQQLRETTGLVRRVLAQTRARVLRGNPRFPAKLLSLFEPHTEAIRKGKAVKPTEFGKLVKIQEGEVQFEASGGAARRAGRIHNAGKSSLMRVLTGSHVLVADKLFATLDTTVRALWPETRPRILVSDTVGFIKKLPHDLVASFRSTLDEVLEASLLLQIVDAADPVSRAQMQVIREVLDEIGAGDVPRILVLNKIDKVAQTGRSC
jgi:50S ribosome-binding GTPase